MKNVLILESDPVFRDHLTGMVKECNCRVLQTYDVDDTLQKICNSRVHILISQWSREVSNEYAEMVASIRMNHRSRRIHVLVTSDEQSSDYIGTILKCGVDDYLSRPITVSELRKRLLWASSRGELLI